MAILKAVPLKNRGSGSLKDILDYVKNGAKTQGETFLWGKDCQSENPLMDMELTKKLFHKTGGRLYAHLIHSFDVNDEVSPELAMEIGQKFLMNCPQLRDFQVFMAVHTDQEHMHLRYVVNSVSHKDGHKWQCSKRDLEEMRGVSDDLCRKYGLSVIEKRKNFNMNYGEYKNQNSWKSQLAKDVSFCLGISRSWEEFALELEERGIEIAIYPPNLGDYTVVFAVPEGYSGLKEGRMCSSNKLCGYGDFSYKNLCNILEFNATNEELGDWDSDVLYSFLQSFDVDEEFCQYESEYGIDWKSLCWEEIQVLIGKIMTRQKENQARNELVAEKNQNKERFQMLLTCGEEWLEWRLELRDKDWER